MTKTYLRKKLFDIKLRVKVLSLLVKSTILDKMKRKKNIVKSLLVSFLNFVYILRDIQCSCEKKYGSFRFLFTLVLFKKK